MPLIAMSHTTDAKPCLTVNLNALTQNYRVLASLTKARVAAVVKADAYGLGLEAVCQALWRANCRTFFVAFTDEGLTLRSLLPDAEIYVFTPFIADDAQALLGANLKPCLYSFDDAQSFARLAAKKNQPAHVALHVETGINRLGMSRIDFQKWLSWGARDSMKINLLMSHLACADQPASLQNPEQLERFQFFKNLLPDTKYSLANSGGVLLGPEYHMDLVRPGIALYGHDPHYDSIETPRVKPVAALETKIAQIKELQAGDTLGYGATVTCRKPTRVAAIMGGYADGIMRSLGNEQKQPYDVIVNGKPAPIIGRVSMDLCAIDVTGFRADEVKVGDRVELFGSQCPVESMAQHAGTIPYEILTHIGSRVPRVYVE